MVGQVPFQVGSFFQTLKVVFESGSFSRRYKVSLDFVGCAQSAYSVVCPKPSNGLNNNAKKIVFI